VNVPSVSPAPRTASGDGSVRPSSAGSVSSLPGNPTSHGPGATASPAPSPAPPPSTTTPVKADSPAPVRPPSSSSYPVHKLKKAWLQRHSGEDGTEDTTGIVGSGSCLTLPLNIAASKQSNGTTGEFELSRPRRSSEICQARARRLSRPYVSR
jgi:lysine-specific demethylase 3